MLSETQQQQGTTKTPPAPPIRQGSALSSTNSEVLNTHLLGVANNTSTAVSGNQQPQEAEPTSNDQVRVFEGIEGTPLNFSTATSFSDLSVDDVEPSSGIISRDADDGLIQLHQHRSARGQARTQR